MTVWDWSFMQFDFCCKTTKKHTRANISKFESNFGLISSIDSSCRQTLYQPPSRPTFQKKLSNNVQLCLNVEIWRQHRCDFKPFRLPCQSLIKSMQFVCIHTIENKSSQLDVSSRSLLSHSFQQKRTNNTQIVHHLCCPSTCALWVLVSMLQSINTLWMSNITHKQKINTHRKPLQPTQQQTSQHCNPHFSNRFKLCWSTLWQHYKHLFHQNMMCVHDSMLRCLSLFVVWISAFHFFWCSCIPKRQKNQHDHHSLQQPPQFWTFGDSCCCLVIIYKKCQHLETVVVV